MVFGAWFQIWGSGFWGLIFAIWFQKRHNRQKKSFLKFQNRNLFCVIRLPSWVPEWVLSKTQTFEQNRLNDFKIFWLLSVGQQEFQMIWLNLPFLTFISMKLLNFDHFWALKFVQTAAGNSLKQCEEAASIKQLSSSLSDCYIKASGQVNSGTIDVWSPDSSASQYTSENASASFTTLIRQCQNKTMVVAMCDCMTIIDSWSRSNNIISWRNGINLLRFDRMFQLD